MCNSAKHNSRPGRESLSKRLGRVISEGIRARDNHRCVYCKRTEARSGAAMHLDHLTPRSKGGKDTPRNLVLACARCNSARKDLRLNAWAAKAKKDLRLTIDPKAIRNQARRKLPKAA